LKTDGPKIIPKAQVLGGGLKYFSFGKVPL